MRRSWCTGAVRQAHELAASRPGHGLFAGALADRRPWLRTLRWQSTADRRGAAVATGRCDLEKWKAHSLSASYSYEHHVAVAEVLDHAKQLPPTFMLLPPHSWHPDVWTDVTRMLTLNGAQHAKGNELHICPLQFDIVDRAIVQHSMAGETVMDPFGGLMTTPYRAVKLGRLGIGIELNPDYFADGVRVLPSGGTRGPGADAVRDAGRTRGGGRMTRSRTNERLQRDRFRQAQARPELRQPTTPRVAPVLSHLGTDQAT